MSQHDVASLIYPLLILEYSIHYNFYCLNLISSMVVKAYRQDPFQTTHENLIFDQLFNELQRVWGDSEELVLLFGNFRCTRYKEIDAILIKRKSITIIEFKDYGGNITCDDLGLENGQWFADNTPIQAGQQKNPCVQIKTNKAALIKFFENIDYSSNKNLELGHISGIVVFHQSIACDNIQVPNPLKSWFHIVDFDNLLERLSQIASPRINFDNEQLNDIAKKFNVPEYIPINSKNPTTKNTYSAEINRENPTAFLFAIDCSRSMSNLIRGNELSKAQVLSNVMNELFRELITKCTKAEGVKDYFYLGVIAYNTDNNDEKRKQIFNPLEKLANNFLNPISSFETNYSRMDELQKRIKTNNIERNIKIQRPVWFDPICEGRTPMVSALKKAYSVLQEWCSHHPDSYPPLLIHITDGMSTDGNPEQTAQQIKELSTNDGQVLVFNINLSQTGGKEVVFPSKTLNDRYADQLFLMSSYLPENMATIAEDEGLDVSLDSRCFAYNVSQVNTLAKLLDIGTRVRA